MVTALIGAIGAVVVALIALTGTLLAGRSSRALTLQELEIWKALPPESQSALHLKSLRDLRIRRWHKKATTYRVWPYFLGLFAAGYILLVGSSLLSGNASEIFDAEFQRYFLFGVQIAGLFLLIGAFAFMIWDVGRDFVRWWKGRRKASREKSTEGDAS